MIVHRLDMATSGCVIMARTDAALKDLNRQVYYFFIYSWEVGCENAKLRIFFCTRRKSESLVWPRTYPVARNAMFVFDRIPMISTSFYLPFLNLCALYAPRVDGCIMCC